MDRYTRGGRAGAEGVIRNHFPVQLAHRPAAV